MQLLVAAAIAAAWAPVPLTAQHYQGSPLSADTAHRDLRNLAPGMVIGDFTGGYIGTSGFLASSWLPPEGKAPVARGEDPESDAMAYDSWTSMYGPLNAGDDDPSTAWCEGVAGQGIGEVLLAPSDLSLPQRIWTGYGKSQRLRERNSRPRRVRVWALQAESVDWNQNDRNYRSVRALAFRELELEDRNGWQPLALPDLPPDSLTEGAGLVGIQILSVYPGSAYEDTLVSGLGTDGAAASPASIREDRNPGFPDRALPQIRNTMTGALLTLSGTMTEKDFLALLGPPAGTTERAGLTGLFWAQDGVSRLEVLWLEGKLYSVHLMDSRWTLDGVGPGQDLSRAVEAWGSGGDDFFMGQYRRTTWKEAGVRVDHDPSTGRILSVWKDWFGRGTP